MFVAILKFIFSFYSVACYLFFLMAVQISAFTVGENSLGDMQIALLPYGIGLYGITGVICLILAIKGGEYAGNKIIKKKEGYEFYYKFYPFLPGLIGAGIMIFTTFLTVLLCASDVSDEAFFSPFTWVTPPVVLLIIFYKPLLGRRWSEIGVKENTLTVKFTKFGFPTTRNLKEEEIQEVYFKTIIQPTSNETLRDRQLKKLKTEIDKSALDLAGQANGVTDFMEKIRKVKPDTEIIIDKLILKTVDGSKVPIEVAEYVDFKKFSQIFLSKIRPVIKWRSLIFYNS